MARYISADTFKQRLLAGSELDPEPCKGFRSALLAMVDTQEDADVRENVHGRWIVDEDGNIECSVCGHHGVGDLYCERCGAQMDEVE